MKIAVFADVHLSRYSQDKIEDVTNLPERLSSIKKVLYEIADYCISNEIKHVAIGGDISHNKSIIYSIAQDLMLQYFNDYKSLNFFVIDGNHDLSSKGEEAVSALRPLENIPNVKWISHKETYRLSGEDILFVPYSYNLPKIIKKNKARILISHFGLNEGILNSGISIVSDIALNELIGRYELVILGHYHKPQEIIKPEIKFYYTGSIIQLDWGEKNEEKRFLVIDTDKLEVESIPITSYKKHIEIELTEENKDQIASIAKAANEAGHHFKVVMKEKIDISSLKIPEDVNIVDKTEKDITNRGITSSMTHDDKLKRYIEIKEISKEKIESYFVVAKEIIDLCEE